MASASSASSAGSVFAFVPDIKKTSHSLGGPYQDENDWLSKNGVFINMAHAIGCDTDAQALSVAAEALGKRVVTKMIGGVPSASFRVVYPQSFKGPGSVVIEFERDSKTSEKISLGKITVEYNEIRKLVAPGSQDVWWLLINQNVTATPEFLKNTNLGPFHCPIMPLYHDAITGNMFDKVDSPFQSLDCAIKFARYDSKGEDKLKVIAPLQLDKINVKDVFLRPNLVLFDEKTNETIILNGSAADNNEAIVRMAIYYFLAKIWPGDDLMHNTITASFNQYTAFGILSFLKMATQSLAQMSTGPIAVYLIATETGVCIARYESFISKVNIINEKLLNICREKKLATEIEQRGRLPLAVSAVETLFLPMCDKSNKSRKIHFEISANDFFVFSRRLEQSILCPSFSDEGFQRRLDAICEILPMPSIKKVVKNYPLNEHTFSTITSLLIPTQLSFFPKLCAYRSIIEQVVRSENISPPTEHLLRQLLPKIESSDCSFMLVSAIKEYLLEAIKVGIECNDQFGVYSLDSLVDYFEATITNKEKYQSAVYERFLTLWCFSNVLTDQLTVANLLLKHKIIDRAQKRLFLSSFFQIPMDKRSIEELKRLVGATAIQDHFAGYSAFQDGVDALGDLKLTEPDKQLFELAFFRVPLNKEQHVKLGQLVNDHKKIAVAFNKCKYLSEVILIHLEYPAFQVGMGELQDLKLAEDDKKIFELAFFRVPLNKEQHVKLGQLVNDHKKIAGAFSKCKHLSEVIASKMLVVTGSKAPTKPSPSLFRPVGL